MHEYDTPYWLIMSILFITTCTSRKRVKTTSVIRAHDLPKGSLHDVFRVWKKRIRSKMPNGLTPAKNLYCGRGFSEVIDISKDANIETWVISAGLGLIPLDCKIPTYDLTVASGNENNIALKVKDFEQGKWWEKVCELHGRSLSELISDSKYESAVLALNRSYLGLVCEDLLQLRGAALKKIRILGLREGRCLSQKLLYQCINYDHRIDDPQKGIPGTKSDYAQRIARHFINKVLHFHPNASTNHQQQVVDRLLLSMKQPRIPKRKKQTDEEIIVEIREICRENVIKKSASACLRILRNGKKIACEQKRFSKLYSEVVQEAPNGGKKK